jgi:hypothetical protein
VTKLITTSTPGSRNWDLETHVTVPPEALAARRLETLVIGVMGQLEATANWHQILGELLDAGAVRPPLASKKQRSLDRRRGRALRAKH